MTVVPLGTTVIAFLGYVPYDTQSGILGKRIVAGRLVKGMTQKELARRLGVDPSTLAQWETGTGQPLRRHHERVPACPAELATAGRPGGERTAGCTKLRLVDPKPIEPWE